MGRRGLSATLTLSARLDNATMTALNAQVDIEKRPVEDVAGLFLRAVGLI